METGQKAFTIAPWCLHVGIIYCQ